MHFCCQGGLPSIFIPKLRLQISGRDKQLQCRGYKGNRTELRSEASCVSIVAFSCFLIPNPLAIPLPCSAFRFESCLVLFVDRVFKLALARNTSTNISRGLHIHPLAVLRLAPCTAHCLDVSLHLATQPALHGPSISVASLQTVQYLDCYKQRFTDWFPEVDGCYCKTQREA